MLELSQAENGWVITDREERRIWVQSYDDDSKESEVEAFANLLWDLNEIIGPTTSRRSPKRIMISTVPGDKCDEV